MFSNYIDGFINMGGFRSCSMVKDKIRIIMENITNFLVQYPELIYGICVVILAFIVFKYIYRPKAKTKRLLVLISCGLILGIVFSLVTSIRWPIMIFAFLASVGFYEVIIKTIMRKFNISYDKN